MPYEPGADSLDTGRYSHHNRARLRARMMEAGDLLRDRTVRARALHRDVFAQDVAPEVSDARPPSYHDEAYKQAHEQGTPGRAATDDHNHDHTYTREDGATDLAETPADYVEPFANAAEGPNPEALPTQYSMRLATWDVADYDREERIKGGPIEVWARYSLDSGATWGRWTLRAVVPPGSTDAAYEVRDVEFNPDFYSTAPQVEVYVRQMGDDQTPNLKLVRTGSDGKIALGFLPSGVGDMTKAVYDTDDDGAVDVAEGLKETGGPTTLAMGAVADGEYVKRSGGNLVGGDPRAEMGAFYANVVVADSAASPYNITADDFTVLGDTTGGPVFVNLPAATGSGRILNVKFWVDGGDPLTIAPSGGDTIDGSAAALTPAVLISFTFQDVAAGEWAII